MSLFKVLDSKINEPSLIVFSSNLWYPVIKESKLPFLVSK